MNLLFRSRAQEVVPEVRSWMNIHSRLVTISVYIVFILFG